MTSLTRQSLTFACCLLMGCALGCRGNRSTDPPVHLQQNMDFQPFGTQEENVFFADRRAMRTPVPNTVPRDATDIATPAATGKKDGAFIDALPMPLTPTFLARGKARYDIYCAVCHSRVGDGKSILMKRNMRVPPPSYLEPRLLEEPLGYFYDVIANGIRNMPGYRSQISITDRWAIAAYVRALQLAGTATLQQVPRSIATEKGWTTP